MKSLIDTARMTLLKARYGNRFLTQTELQSIEGWVNLNLYRKNSSRCIFWKAVKGYNDRSANVFRAVQRRGGKTDYSFQCEFPYTQKYSQEFQGGFRFTLAGVSPDNLEERTPNL